MGKKRGKRRRALKNRTKAVGRVKTGITFEGCDLCIIVGDPSKGKKVAPLFRSYLGQLIVKSRNMTIVEMFHFSFGMRKKMLNGESIWN